MQRERMEKQVELARKAYLQQKREKYLEVKGSQPSDDELHEWMEMDNEQIALRHESEIYLLALRNMGKVSNEIGRTILIEVWDAWLKGLHLATEDELMEEWVVNGLKGFDTDLDYMKAMARVVDCIFVWYHQYIKDDNPLKVDGVSIFIEDSDDNSISLISDKGYISKLKENAFYFSQIENRSDKEAFIQMLASESRSKIQAHKALSKNRDRKSKSSGVKFKLTKEEVGDKIVITIPQQKLSLTPSQAKAFLDRFKNHIDVID
jgi:hypothetical protein